MPQTYRAKDGTVHRFPDDATPEEIQALADEVDGYARPKPARSDRELFAFNSPYMQETHVSPLQMLAATAKATFGNDRAAADYLAEKGGGSVQDVEGRPVLVSPKGERYNLNDPGFGLSDAESLGTNALAFAPAGSMAAAAPSLGGKIGLGALGSGATDAALQLGSTGRVDPARVGSTAAFGAGGELLAPFFGAVFRASKTGSMSRQELILRGRHQLARMRANGIDDNTAMRLGQELDQIQAGGDPRAMLSEAEFGLRYTQGQKTGDLRQLNREEMLRNTSGSRGGDLLRQNDDYNYGRVVWNMDELQRDITGKPGRVNVNDAVDRAGATVRQEAQALDSRVEDAYTRFRSTKAYAGADAQRVLPGRISIALRDFDISRQTTPAGARALEMVQANFGSADQAMSATRLDGMRRRLRSIQGTALNPTDKAVTQKVIREFDAWLDDTAAAGLIGGDQQAIATLKEARKLRTEYGVRFGDSAEFSKRFDTVVRQMIEDGADPETMARTIYGASQVSQQWANRALVRIDLALGKNPEARRELRAAVLTKLTQGRNGETVTLGQLQNNLRTLLTESPALARNVLGPDGVNKVGRLISGITPLLRTADKRSSGTAERMWRYLSATVTGLPGLGRILEGLKNAGDVPAAMRALSPLEPTRHGFLPAVGAATGSEWDR